MIEHLNTIGLGLDIVGVFLLFVFGWPPGISQDGAPYWTSKQRHSENVRRGKIFACIRGGALCLIMLGFLLQIVSNYV